MELGWIPSSATANLSRLRLTLIWRFPNACTKTYVTNGTLVAIFGSLEVELPRDGRMDVRQT